jgi:hypothetical protein
MHFLKAGFTSEIHEWIFYDFGSGPYVIMEGRN